MLITDPTAKDPRKSSRKVASVTVAIVVHLVLLVIAALVVISTRSKPEPEIVANVIGPTQQAAPQMEKKAVMGYARAARLLDIMEEKGLIGPVDGAKPRKIFVENFRSRSEDVPTDLAA